MQLSQWGRQGHCPPTSAQQQTFSLDRWLSFLPTSLIFYFFCWRATSSQLGSGQKWWLGAWQRGGARARHKPIHQGCLLMTWDYAAFICQDMEARRLGTGALIKHPPGVAQTSGCAWDPRSQGTEQVRNLRRWPWHLLPATHPIVCSDQFRPRVLNGQMSSRAHKMERPSLSLKCGETRN